MGVTTSLQKNDTDPVELRQLIKTALDSELPEDVHVYSVQLGTVQRKREAEKDHSSQSSKGQGNQPTSSGGTGESSLSTTMKTDQRKMLEDTGQSKELTDGQQVVEDWTRHRARSGASVTSTSSIGG